MTLIYPELKMKTLDEIERESSNQIDEENDFEEDNQEQYTDFLNGILYLIHSFNKNDKEFQNLNLIREQSLKSLEQETERKKTLETLDRHKPINNDKGKIQDKNISEEDETEEIIKK